MDTELVARLRAVIPRLARVLNDTSTGEDLTPTQYSVLALVRGRGPQTSVEAAPLPGVARGSRRLDQRLQLGLAPRTAYGVVGERRCEVGCSVTRGIHASLSGADLLSELAVLAYALGLELLDLGLHLLQLIGDRRDRPTDRNR